MKVLASPKYRADIDGLRALAVLSVVVYHAFPSMLKGGFIGVDIFFVISGFLISTILFENLEKNSFSFLTFYINRIKRIFPALVLVLLVTLLIGWYILLSNEFEKIGKHILGGSFFISNFILWNESGYFDQTSETKPLLHLWSLGIEEQFYIAWPLVTFIIWKINQHKFILIASILIAASFSYSVYLTESSITAAFYSPLSRAWELLLGAVLAWYVLHRSKSQYCVKGVAVTNHFFSLLGIGFIVYALVFTQENTVFPGWWALYPTLGAMLIIFAGPHAVLNRYFLANPVVVWFGLISYTLYLWHWPLISYANILTGAYDPSRSIRIGLVALSILLAWLTYRYIETPMRKNKNNMVTKVLVASMVCVATIGLLAFISNIKSRLSAPSVQKVIAATEEWTYPEKEFYAFSHLGHEIDIRYSSLNSKVLYVGDSNIQQYSTRINELINLYPERTHTAVFSTRGSCPPISNVRYVGRVPVNCDGFIDSTLDYLKNTPDIVSVVLGASWPHIFSNSGSNRYVINQKLNNGKMKDLYSGLEKTIEEIKATHKDIYLVLKAPYHNAFDPRNIVDRYQRNLEVTGPVINMNNFLQGEDLAIRNHLIEIAHRHGVKIIDPLGADLCPKGGCISLTPEGKPIYKDINHLAPSFVKKNVKYLDKTILISPIK